MPIYTYRREDGTTFEIRQSFADDALTEDPVTGQKVSRVVQNAGVIFKGSGFYKNDHKDASKANMAGSTKESKDAADAPAAPKTEAAAAPAATPTPAPAATPS